MMSSVSFSAIDAVAYFLVVCRVFCAKMVCAKSTEGFLLADSYNRLMPFEFVISLCRFIVIFFT